MIKRENLKQAIDAISKRDPEIGYSLDAMLGTGDIGVPGKSDAGGIPGNPYFLFKGQKVHFRKYQYFHEGTVPLEQKLLVKYGELAKKQQLQENHGPLDYRKAAEEIHQAGLQLMVGHEIDYAVTRIRGEQAQLKPGNDEVADRPDLPEKGSAGHSTRRRLQVLSGLISFLETVKHDDRPLQGYLDQADAISDPVPQFEGVVDYATPARFIPFPFCLDALLQTAAMNLEFFHVRFLLTCLIEHSGNRLYTCVVQGKILGLIFLELRTHYLKQSLEIKYLATTGGLEQVLPDPRLKKVRGVGTFLVAGAWLLWKSRFPKAKEMVLNAEIGAMRFYRSIGFRPRRPFEYVLKQPTGYLLRSILVMVNNCTTPAAELIAEAGHLIEVQIKRLHKSSRGQAAQVQRKMIFAFLRACLQSRTHPILADRLVRHLLKYRHKLPEASILLDLAAESGWVRLYRAPLSNVQPLLVACSDQFSRHLENIFHLENAKRIQAIQSVLHHRSLQDKWVPIEPRMATVDELAWVHTAEHIERIAQTAGKPLSTLDPDTQTSEQSYQTARRAVGAVFSLLDAIWAGRGTRGFACIRPPGHHAEPDKAMGFCLFNNVALGARYLQNRYAVKKVMIVDIDAHHGNGTQRVFYDSDEVLYVSLHRFPGFPGTGNYGEIGCGQGTGFTVNVPLGNGHGDRDFIEIIHFLANPLARSFQPQIVLVSCGFDLYLHDRLGGMRATPEGYAFITASLLAIAEQVCDGRIVFVMEGGYSIRGIQECGLTVLQELCNVSAVNRTRLNQIVANPAPKLAVLKKVIEIHRTYWPSLH
jgi:acetoin utilization deacetylase AcuC-like enzyme